MNEPDQIHADSIAGSKPPAGRDAPGGATFARSRDTLGKPDSGDMERAFHWMHFQDPHL